MNVLHENFESTPFQVPTWMRNAWKNTIGADGWTEVGAVSTDSSTKGVAFPDIVWRSLMLQVAIGCVREQHESTQEGFYSRVHWHRSKWKL